MSDGVSVEVLQAIFDAFNDHDLDRIMAFAADDCDIDMPRGPYPFGARFIGKDNVRKALEGRFAGLPDVHYANPIHFVSGSTGITKWLLTGTTPTGVQIEVFGCDFYTFRDGKITKKDAYWKIVEA
jgi:ketosteroid isomerase-like protein